MKQTEKSRTIVVHNAQTHNLKNISLEIPKNKLVVFTGVSGSGKSSLVFDTIYTEAQRQLLETFSSFARRFLPKLSRPPVDAIENISTAIVIDQKKMGTNLRSTVGTATEIGTYLRMLFSRAGQPLIGPSFYFGFNHPEGMCPDCHGLGKKIRVDVELLVDKTKTLREGAFRHPDYKTGGWNWKEIVGSELFDNDKPLSKFTQAELDRLLFTEPVPIPKKNKTNIYRNTFEGVARKLEANANRKGENESDERDKDAYEQFFTYQNCGACNGHRLNERARSVRVAGKNISELSAMELSELRVFLAVLNGKIEEALVGKMIRMLDHLIDIGVGYLSLIRSVATLSGGESQRVKMARQLDCDLVNLLYIFDEPSVGLHPRDTGRLITLLADLRDRDNSLLVVEHDPDVILAADWVVDIGPVAGSGGGHLLFSGTPAELIKSGTPTGQALTRRRDTVYQRKNARDFYTINNARAHNLKNLSVNIPRGVLTCVTGVAGSGKSSLIHDVFCAQHPEAVLVDQNPVGRSSRSNPLTYLGIFDEIRKTFAKTTGTEAALFSFNSKGSCPKCNGLGYVRIEMSFLDEVRMTCDECDGKRYREEVLKLLYKGKSISDVLDMTVADALAHFDAPAIKTKLAVLAAVGLDYLETGQPLSTLSGGEAQRIKLANELHKKSNCYVMDEPTTGLHLADIRKLVTIIDELVANDNTVIVIEHNLDLILRADWIIDLGPEGGAAGGEIIFEGTIEDLVKCKRSHTGRHVKALMEKQ